MVTLKINDKEAVKCPVCWEEVTVGTYQALMALDRNDPDILLRIFCALTGANFDGVLETRNEDVEAGIYQVASFVVNTPEEFRKKPRAKTFSLAGHTVTVPDNLGRLTVGQNLQIRSCMKSGAKLETLISKALSIYLQPLIDVGPFSSSRAAELEKEVLKMNIFDAFPVGFFLLSKLNNSGASGLLYWLQVKIAKAKRRLKMPNWLAFTSLSLCMTSACLTNTATGTGNSLEWSSKSHLMNLYPSSYSGRSGTNIDAVYKKS